MQFTVLGLVALTSLVSAIPLEGREFHYGDRTEYASAYNAAQPPPEQSYSPAPGGGQGGSGGSAGSSGGGSDQGGSGKGPWSPPQQDHDLPPAPQQASDKPFALDNGFPNIKNPSDELTDINLAARGTLSNAPPPAKSPSEETLKSLRLVAFNELFEVFYFTELLTNITEGVPGYEFQDQALKKKVINVLTAVQAQEELHMLNANNALRNFNAGPIEACQYNAPVDNFHDAIFLASTFTDIVLGTLADISVVAGQNGDAGNIRGFTASLGQEGEQNGFYRDLLGKLPSALPFLTASLRDFAFSALNQNFVVEGSCPNINTIDLKIFGTLTVLTPNPIEPRDQDLEFSFKPKDGKADGLSLVYINQQNVPVVQPIQSGKPGQDGVVTFTSPLPFEKNLMNGLTIAAVVEGEGPFPNITSVAAKTLYGPGLVEIN